MKRDGIRFHGAAAGTFSMHHRRPSPTARPLALKTAAADRARQAGSAWSELLPHPAGVRAPTTAQHGPRCASWTNLRIHHGPFEFHHGPHHASSWSTPLLSPT